MLKSIRTAAFVMVLGVGATASAWEGIKVGKDGSVKMGAGDTRVDVASGGDVSVRAPSAQVNADARTSSSRGDEGGSRGGDRQIKLEGLGQKQTVTCEKGAEVLIEGTANDYSIEGECMHVSVSGTSNKVRVVSVGRVTVEGTSNVVTWEHGLGTAKKPKISTEGVNNKVLQAR